MYPYELFWGIDLYQMMIAIGFLAALIYFRVLADKTKMSATLQNICIVAALASLVGGYLFAVLFQAIYNAIASGHFLINNHTGSTFYGGLIGGVITFVSVVLVGKKIRLPKGDDNSSVMRIMNIAIGGVVLAHAFGRIGCLFAGCCHGKITEAWYGIWNAGLGAKTVPTQLFEALFLFALCAFLTWNERKGRRNNIAFYCILYGAWRFGIEFIRADERGKTIIPFLTPSQLVAVILFVVGVVLLAVAWRRREKNHE